jgi:predicted AAA+ superfamily ATPase
MIQRNEYLSQLLSFCNKDIIKVITGIRRCGKSTLLKLFIDQLKADGVKDEQIVFVNFESAEFESVQTYQDLRQYIAQRIYKGGKTYILLDEVQRVEGFEKAVDGFTVDYDVDIYLTGSNAKMLSTDLSTLLSGRYVEIKMYPLSFAEYMTMQGGQRAEDCFLEYMKYGGFPFLTSLTGDSSLGKEQAIDAYLDGIFNTVILKDVIEKNKIKDTALVKKIVSFAFSAMGSIVSPTSIAKQINNGGSSVSNETVERYLSMLCDACILYTADRYDIKGKAYLKTLSKYYVADLGLRNHVLGYRQVEPTHALENIVYFEFLRRGYKVDIGKINEYEVDFIARNTRDIKYIQVSWSVDADSAVLQRECRPFDAIADHYEKIILTMDRSIATDINGIKKYNALDFLLGRG